MTTKTVVEGLRPSKSQKNILRAIVTSFSTASKTYLYPKSNKAEIRADNVPPSGGEGGVGTQGKSW